MCEKRELNKSNAGLPDSGKLRGDETNAGAYLRTAKSYPAEWIKMSNDGERPNQRIMCIPLVSHAPRNTPASNHRREPDDSGHGCGHP
jgi:hypothetical protein